MGARRQERFAPIHRVSERFGSRELVDPVESSRDCSLESPSRGRARSEGRSDNPDSASTIPREE